MNIDGNKEKTSCGNLISTALDLKESLSSALFESDYSKADQISFEYGRVIEEIISYQANSIADYEIKIQFFFETLLECEGDEIISSKCKKSLIKDLSKFKVSV